MKFKDYAILILAGVINFAAFRWASICPYLTGLMLGYIVLAKSDWERLKAIADDAIATSDKYAAMIDKMIMEEEKANDLD